MRLARIRRTFLVVNPGAVFTVLFAPVVFACAYLLILGAPDYASINSVFILACCFSAVGIVLLGAGSIRAKALGERV